MKLLELFCGTKSITKEFIKVGFDCLTIDIDPQFEPDIVADIRALNPDNYKGYDVIWASPPCNAFSVARINRNWTVDNQPRTPHAVNGLEILTATISFLARASPKIFWIENPRGKMRTMNIMPCAPITVTYCQYGENRMKPTDIWTNCTTWNPAKPCSPGAPCHVAAPRGSKTGTQGMGPSSVSAVIPPRLCAEIAQASLEHLRTM